LHPHRLAPSTVKAAAQTAVSVLPGNVLLQAIAGGDLYSALAVGSVTSFRSGGGTIEVVPRSRRDKTTLGGIA
jgi:hypothetical protein